MKLSNFQTNPEHIEKGIWVKDIPFAEDLEVRTRGAENNDWRRIYQRELMRLPMKRRRKALDIVEAERIDTVCCLEAGIQDWNLTDDTGQKVPVEQAKELFFDAQWRRLRDACITAARMVADAEAEGDAVIEGNSASASETTSSGAPSETSTGKPSKPRVISAS